MMDYALGSTFDIKFTSRAFATGIPTVLAGSPIIVIYEDNGTTEITVAETLTVDFDGVVGLNNLRVVATDGNGFETGKSYSAVLSVGTVGGVSVVGETVVNFTIGLLATSEQVGSIGSGATGGTHVDATYDNTTRDTIDNLGEAVDKGSGLVGIPVTGHTFVAGREVTIAGTDNFDGVFEVISQTTNEVVITATFGIGETFAGSDTIVASIKGQIFVGTVTSGTFADVSAQQGDLHSIDDVGDDIDIIYGFNVGGSREATLVEFFVNVNGNTDEMACDAFDFIGDAFVPKKLIPGSGGSAFVELAGRLINNNTGTGTEIGDAFIRFRNNSTTPSSIDVDLCLLLAVGTNVLIGYPNGFEIQAAGTSGTEFGVNGTAGNPCPFADAITMNAIHQLNQFAIHNGESIELLSSADGLTLQGVAWTLDLSDESIAGALFEGPHVTGVGTSSGDQSHFTNAKMGACTIPPSFLMTCGIGEDSGTLTGGSAGEFIFDECYSLAPGSAVPVFTFTGLGSATGINNRGWKGGATWNVDSDITLSHCVLVGGGTTFNTSGADIEVRGTIRSLTVAFTTGGTTPAVQFVGITGPITLSGTAAAGTTVNLYGVSSSLTNTSSNTTVVDATTSRTNYNGGDWALNTNSGGSIRIVEGTGTGEIDLTGGLVALVNASITVDTFSSNAIDGNVMATNSIGADQLAPDGITEIRNAVTGGNYALSTDVSGRIRIVDGTGAGEINTDSGAIVLVQTTTAVTNDVTTDSASRTASKATGFSTPTNVTDAHATTDALITGISNVTRLSVGLPTYMERPPSGDKAIKVVVALKDLDGNMEDPDGNQLALTLSNSAGTSRNTLLFKEFALTTALDAGTGTFSGYKQLERTSTGLYFFYTKVAFDATEEEWLAQFGWEEGTVALYELRATQVTDAANDLGVLLTRCTEARLAELDPANLPADIAAVKTDTGNLVTTIGVAGLGLTDLGGMSTGMKSEARVEAAGALSAIFLNQIFAADYDPASKPGVATALFNELIESNAGVSRYTVASLANAPSGSGSSPAVIAAEVWDTLIASHTDVTTFGGTNQKEGVTYVLPAVSSPSSSGRIAPASITAYQHTRLQAVRIILDSDDTPIDLSGVIVLFKAWDKDDPSTVIIAMTSDGVGAELTIGGANNNEVTIDGAVTHTATARQLDWRLYDGDTSVALDTGVLKIEEGPDLA